MTRMSANRPLETDDALTLAGAGRRDGALATMKRGLRLVPELRQGLGLTLLLALIATGGRVVVPLAVQQTLAFVDGNVLGRPLVDRADEVADAEARLRGR